MDVSREGEKNGRRRTWRIRALLLLMIVVSATIGGCVRKSGETWIIESAPRPEGWPELTPVGRVEVKSYPTYRAAIVRDLDLTGDGMESMFRELFGHISRNEVDMTAPVDMTFDRADAEGVRMASMAFLYRSTDVGDTERDGPVTVRDLVPSTFVSVGVRGDYTNANMLDGLARLEGWLEENAAKWRIDGPVRYLGYNGPFVPEFMMYGEVQIPVRSVR